MYCIVSTHPLLVCFCRVFTPCGVIGALPLTIIVLTLNFPLHQCTEYHDTVGPNFSTRDASPWIQLFKGCSAASHFSTFCLNTSKYSILLKCILCRWLYHIYGWGSVHCIEDAPNTGSSAWLISRLGHYSLTAASRSVFDICPDQREGADQHLTRIQQHTREANLYCTDKTAEHSQVNLAVAMRISHMRG